MASDTDDTVQAAPTSSDQEQPSPAAGDQASPAQASPEVDEQPSSGGEENAAPAGGEHASPADGELHTETQAHGGADDHGSDVFPPFDSTTFASQLVWLAIAFGLFYYLMSKMILPRIAQTLEQRHDRIASDLAEAERLKNETDAAIAAYEQALTEARQKAGDIARSTRERVQEAIEADRTEAETALADKLAEAETRIGEVRTKALAEVDTIAADAAQALIGSLGGVKVTKTELTKTVGDVRAQ